jgi:hypothetical protein
MTDAEIKMLIAQFVETIEVMSDEVAELVDQFHRPHLAKDQQHVAVAKSQAVIDSVSKLRKAVDSVLGTSARSEVRP